MKVRYGLRHDPPEKHKSLDASLIVCSDERGWQKVETDLTLTPLPEGGVQAIMPGLGWQGLYSSENAAIDAAKAVLKYQYLEHQQ